MGVHGVEYAFDYALIVPLLGAALLWSFGLLAWTGGAKCELHENLGDYYFYSPLRKTILIPILLVPHLAAV